MTMSQTLGDGLRAVGTMARRIGRASRSRQRDQLLLVPRDPRTPDPIFARELAFGQLGLAGTVVDLAGRSPFAVTPPSEAWARELHGFGWLRHLGATGAPFDQARARRLVADWWRAPSGGAARQNAVAWQGDVAGRRLIAWLANANVLIEGASDDFYHTLMDGIGRTVEALERTRRRRTRGSADITASAALVMACLALADRENALVRAERCLLAALDRQILADGGHVGRNPAQVLELLLDLLPLRQCYLARSRPPPPSLLAATRRMAQFLRHVRLGDGSLARFNGTGRIEADALATALSIDPSVSNAATGSGPSGYARLARGDTVIVADCGLLPDGAATTAAGTLAFEMTVGQERLLSNGGWPRHANASILAAARSTANHATLALASSSSSEPHRPQRWTGCGALAGPRLVTGDVRDIDGAAVLAARHDGYAARFNLVHARRVAVAPDGTRVEVEDQLAPAHGVLRTAQDVPFAIHVHLAPEAEVAIALNGYSAVIRLASGAAWQLTVSGARASLEPARDFAHLLGVVATRQIVLRGATAGDTTVLWSLSRSAVA